MLTIGSLFSGVGGLEMGLQMAGCGPVVWACDADPCARAVLAAHNPGVPIFEDVRDINAGTAQPVGLVCGGFPCQPHSLAGKRKGTGDARWLWPEFARVLGDLDPPLAFIENVPGLLASGLRDVLAGLAALGFDAVWDCFSAAEVGAPHIRKRLFVLAYADGRGRDSCERVVRAGQPDASGGGGDMADPLCPRLAIGSEQPARRERATSQRGGSQANAWSAEPDVGRVAYGVPARTHRLRLLGNAVVPAQAALAFRSLAARAAT